ncbi:DUF4442 domain-containing protein [Mangrovivirga sp. M17]|uniref:DUF4442 domain-containing protein n=1 Tax=Mangrovivirga halotolerans TaxID=2993936 RepID=A0ABT3RUQ6_9BACT|nr:DUF4442 domain-containing protein [Mangrovivirga halotolerans]MCX2745353.1 DUF4442 domain-containing protein [Mangrovivirga halotolerans]
MSVYRKIAEVGSKFISKATLFKYGFNLSPMYRRSTGRIKYVSDDLLDITIKIPISYKNKNYVNSIFGGSMFSAVDPIPMVQLMNLLGDNYIVWDKSAKVRFKKPAKENLYADFQFTKNELDNIKSLIEDQNEMELIKQVHLKNKDRSVTFCEVQKILYISDKKHFKRKKRKK